ncbi:MAG: peroxidase-related enzyme [Alphaproteobacteria bacterium]|nr:peroxidase-related enzyme [Alphaproteobacteria bacterium]MCZ6765220.1 peroxidase-related enzyme [Alphaproteobacteria bacterium]
MARMRPLDPAEYGDLAEDFVLSEKAVGFVTNNLRVMARRPEIARSVLALFGAVVMQGSVSKELKYLVSYMASFSAGCMYCAAHTGSGSIRQGAAAEKISAIWNYETSPLFDEAERAALRVAQLAAQTPNAVTDADFDALKAHFSDDEIVEIVSAISLFGFFNRFNDTIAMTLEDPIADFADANLGGTGWEIGKHGA